MIFWTCEALQFVILQLLHFALFSCSELSRVEGILGEHSDPKDLEVMSDISILPLTVVSQALCLLLRKEPVALMGENQHKTVTSPDVHPPFGD